MLFVGMNLALDMKIKGYQFPSEEKGNNANWLIVAIKVSYNGDYWEIDSPCLSTQRLIDFKDWIENICNQDCKCNEFVFSKPDISFSYLGKQKQLYKFRIKLKYGCLPQEFNFNTSVDNSIVFVESFLDLGDLTNFLAIVQQYVTSFPIRH